MADMLSQEEINALLGVSDDETDAPAGVVDELELLTSEQKDVLGEVGNISMGTSATTLFALIGQKVSITTPRVQIYTWRDLAKTYNRPCIGTRIDYKVGIRGSNVIVLKQRDVKVIANLMMGGDGSIDEDESITDLEMSALGEAMNQMIGSASTSLSSMVKTKIDIDTPQPFLLDFSDEKFFEHLGFSPDETIVCVSFKMEVGELIDSEITQILDRKYAIEMVDMLKKRCRRRHWRGRRNGKSGASATGRPATTGIPAARATAGSADADATAAGISAARAANAAARVAARAANADISAAVLFGAERQRTAGSVPELRCGRRHATEGKHRHYYGCASGDYG